MYVYANGWENGAYEAQTTSTNPSRCARMILTRIGGGSIVGVRILRIDGERVDYLIIPDQKGGECGLV
jgi:hypothetical protein